MSSTKFYAHYRLIRDRCDNPNNKSYYHYGGRGITYDPMWKKYENFYNDMHDSYLKAIEYYGDESLITIDRIDSNGNYCKDNCRWVDWKLNKIIEEIIITFL